MFKKLISLLTIILSFSAQSEVIRYNLDWAGINGYTATGYFTYDDSIDHGQFLAPTEMLDLFFKLPTLMG